ncbi:MAG: ATP-binding protein, partial [Chitinispirillia bacterium]|nr:ATP-binding protein [Chitinispirillia bacterium]
MLVLPAIALLLAFLVYISVNTMLTQRLLFLPLAKLTGSVHDVNHDSGKIYGMERKDEIGELARAALDAWSDLNSQTIAIKQRDTLLQAGNQAAALLLDADMEKFEDSLYRSMGIMAKAVNADRVYIFKNHLHEGDLCTTQLYEWSEGATPQQGTKYTVNVSYSKTIPDWGEALSKGECVNSIIHDMWPLSREFMEATQIVSVFIAPIFVKDEFWGFVGFDDCENERKFTENEASILRSACLLIGDAFLRNDITKNLQETADKLEERTRSLELETTMLSTLFDSIPDLIFVKDLSLSYLQCNKSFAEYFACSKEEMIGKSDTDADGVAFSDEEAREYNERDRKVINERKTIVVEEYVPRADGVKQLFETIKAPLVLNGEVIGILGIARDITLRKEMEEAVLGASRSKSAFMASMSHEIRTPMNSIIGFSELAQDDDIPEKTKDYLQKIQSNSEWLLQIINDILDISKIESGKMVLENIPLDLHSIFASCRTVIMPKAIEKGLVMHFYAEPSVGKRLYGDPTRLRQVLVNLLSNAVKFTNSGMIKMQAFVKSVAANSITMCFEVKDSGIGITPEQMVTIFDPFIQAETGTTRKYGGSGLGLSITKNIVEMMGGDLSAESIPGVGTKFSFEIKFDAIDIADDEKLEELIVFDDLEKPTFVGEILLCEDNAMNQQVVREHLARVGLKTVVAENGEEGVCIVKNRVLSGGKEFDLIFMDIHMPVMDGLEAAFKISALNIKTPIVALTANIMSNDLELYKTNGMSGYLGKPFTSKELWKCLAKYIPVASLSEADANQLHKEDEKLLRRLRVNFVRDNENTYDKIINAVGAGDMVLAYRLAHTLKSNAAQLGKKQLQYAAEAVETMLSEGKNLLTEEQTESLKKELKSVLDELAPFIAKAAPVKKLESVDKEKALALIEKLEPLIINSDTASLKFLDELYAVFGDGKFARQIEDFEFKLAAATLEILKRKLAAQ